MPMPDRGPLLTIAVPTFNRVDCLKLLVDEVLRQIDADSQLVTSTELLVCDNASTDGTADYLAALEPREGLRVVRQPRNLGADANIVHCFEAARGRHVWIFGDDDLPLDGVLRRVVDVLRERAPSLLYLPARWISGDLSSFARGAAPTAAVGEAKAMDIAYVAQVYITFISSWIVDRREYMRLSNGVTLSRWCGTSLVQLDWMLTLLAFGERFARVEGNWLLARSGNTGGYSVYEVFITNYAKVVDAMLAGRPVMRGFLREVMLRSHLPGLLWGLRVQVVGEFKPVDPLRVLDLAKAAWPAPSIWRALLRPILVAPRPIARAAFIAGWAATRAWLAVQKLRMRGAAR